ncbi:MAG: sterol desaturase family protein [Alphaproteobacteria bacterium]|nr:sterol desaturase family protein [Alphaproteobacteria bacterium]
MRAFATSILVFAATFLLCYPLEHKTSAGRFRKMDAAYFLDIEYMLLAVLLYPFVTEAIYATAGNLPDILHRLPLISLRPLPLISLRPLPQAAQFLAALFVYDLVNAVRHRFFHKGALWRVHSVHHSAAEVNWVTKFRTHPAENLLIMFLSVAVTLALLGAFGIGGAGAVAAAVVFGNVYGAFIHANCSWTFGPLKRVLASPVYHRWHHSADTAAQDKNFASVFPVIDMVMGTYYMPEDRLPRDLGIGAGQAAYPQTFWRQIIYPFRREKI